MEVHARSHSPRKKWTHYFWEFLMLFLAVFCGFLAEYQLEHTIEQQRSEVYAINLYDELKKDTAELNRVTTEIEFNSQRLDTLCLLITINGIRNIEPERLMRISRYVTLVSFFSSYNSTIEELKGSGGLRLLKPRVSRQISLYDKELKDLETEYALTKAEFVRMEELYFKIIDRNLHETLFADQTTFDKDSLLKTADPVINDDPKLVKEFLGWVAFEKRIYRDQIRDFLLPLKEEANKLLALLKNEYHLE
jgi:hypothetical protein